MVYEKELIVTLLFVRTQFNSVHYVLVPLWMRLWAHASLAMAPSQKVSRFESGAQSCPAAPDYQRDREKVPESRLSPMEIPQNLPRAETTPVHTGNTCPHSPAAAPVPRPFRAITVWQHRGKHRTLQVHEWFMHLSLFMAIKHYNARNK